MSVTAVPIRPIKKGSVAKLWIALAVLALAAAALAWLGTNAQRKADPATFLADNAGRDGVVTTASGLQYEVLKEGSGPTPAASDIVTFSYEGRLSDGEVFDASPPGQPATIPVFGVVPGFSEALQLMNRGAQLRIWLPPELAYGPEERRDPQTGEVTIPANSVLQFDMTLLDFRSLTPEEIQQMQMMQQQMMQQQGAAN